MLWCLRGANPCGFPLAGVTGGLVEMAVTPTPQQGFLLDKGFPFPKFT